MKRRSFVALALACLGIKTIARACQTKTPQPLAPEEIFDVSYHEWPEEIRMDKAGEFAREQIAKELWNTTRGHWEL